MKKIIILVISILIFSNYSFAFDDGDFQHWNTETISWKINKDLTTAIEEEFRFGDDGGDLYYQHTDLGIAYSGLTKWLDIGVNYRLAFEEKNNDWKYINIPHLNGTLKFDLYNFNFSDRSRFEYQDKEEGNDVWRYRNKFTIKLPKFTRFDIQPYVADEIFVDFDEEELNRNRLSTGITWKLLKNLKGDIFYLWQSSKSGGTWVDYNVLGTKLKLSF
ncbi:MAG: hypothetical protein AMJ78_07195 [Omnitrophica WOR_2 bacterium SM23_29]|nr:MAG: hypothetical protein AMJ78_07195 [Omnitrophica WOR_2 bacterium SM23_29]